MYFRQFYLGCLSHASYVIGSGGEAAVIDPQRDVEQYLEEAKTAGLRIKYVIETHLHADFVSGHCELAERTGATIVIAAAAQAKFAHKAVVDGDVLQVGSLDLRVLATPGHTPESICILATDRSDPAVPAKLFTGDTLFVGDAGRPDLSGGSGHSSSEMAAMLYDSLREKILTLPDATEMYPAHGAGSLCGRSMSSETWSTIGKQRIENAALRSMSKEEFVAMMTSGLPESPQYFSVDVRLNREGAPPLESAPDVPLLSPHEVMAAHERGALVLDVRPSDIFGPAHIPYSLNIGLDGQFASWAGSLLEFTQPIVVVTADQPAISEAVTRLARVGFSEVLGALDGGFSAWQDAGLPVASIPQVTPRDASLAAGSENPPQILDVRRPAETRTGIIRGAVTIPLAELKARLGELDNHRETYVVCGSGYRSSAAASILEAAGFSSLLNIDGGMREYNAEGLPTVIPAANVT
jgi:hydroxyacylglutathione hydrolase